MADGMGPLDPGMFIKFREWLDRKLADVRIRYVSVTDLDVGEDVEIYQPSNIYGCKIGWHCRIGPFVEIQSGVVIGSYVKIGSHSFICEGVEIEDRVFVGHGTMFCNDMYPRSTVDCDPVRERIKLKGKEDWICQKTVVRYGASIGTGAVILPGVTIGCMAMVGAGAVVTHDVQNYSKVAGNPARRIGWVKEETGHVAAAN